MPQLLAAVDLDLAPSSSDPEASDKEDFEPFRVKVILLHYIKEFSLWNMAGYSPRSSWQDMVDEAVAVVRVLSDYNILNRDMRPENFMVLTVADSEQQYQVFMIDKAATSLLDDIKAEPEGKR